MSHLFLRNAIHELRSVNACDMNVLFLRNAMKEFAKVANLFLRNAIHELNCEQVLKTPRNTINSVVKVAKKHA